MLKYEQVKDLLTKHIRTLNTKRTQTPSINCTKSSNTVAASGIKHLQATGIHAMNTTLLRQHVVDTVAIFQSYLQQTHALTHELKDRLLADYTHRMHQENS